MCVTLNCYRVIKQALADTEYFSTVFFCRLRGLGTRVQIRLTSTCNINFIIFNLKVFWEKFFKKKINRNEFMKILDQLHSLVISYCGSVRTDSSQSSSYRRKENQSTYKPLINALYHLLTHTQSRP